MRSHPRDDPRHLAHWSRFEPIPVSLILLRAGERGLCPAATFAASMTARAPAVISKISGRRVHPERADRGVSKALCGVHDAS